jgi:serine/threonine-protein kinase
MGLIINNYHIQRELGRGGMAIVYLAHDNKFDSNVAVKVLNKEFVHNENIRKRFIDEARKMFKMSHPNIIKVTDLIEDGDTVAFVMEYIEGETLKNYIDRKGKLSDEEIKIIFTQMLDAVGYVHEQNLVHRDIKPSNFMLDKKGRIKLMDFGIAKTTDVTSADYTQTGTNQNMGTPMYMSPEQIKSTKDVTLQSDIYSLGVVLWQMASGKKPYDLTTLSTFEMQTKIVNEKLPLTGNVFDEIIQTTTHKELNNRFKNCKELINKLSNVQNPIFDKTLDYLDNNSEKTKVEISIDTTVVKSDQNSNTIPKPQINIPVTPRKPIDKSPVSDGFHFVWNKILGIVLLLVAIGFAFTGVGIIATIILGYMAYGLLKQTKDEL